MNAALPLLCFWALTPISQGRGATEASFEREADRPPDSGLCSEEWRGIREAYEAGRHAAVAMEYGYRACNPGQRWATLFDGRGFSTVPDEGGWGWGLELERYGFARSEQAVIRPVEVKAEGGRVSYRWDTVLEEWYVNDTRGFEHGYTVRRRPPRDGGRAARLLTFSLAVRGSLCPSITSDRRGVRFLDEAGAAAVTYCGLSVFDADGRRLPASFELDGECLRLEIDEAGARYPLTIDPIAQRAYIKASNTGAGDWFGFSVAADGGTVVVSAPREKSHATGVNGDQDDNSAPDSGAAYVFVGSGSNWSQQAYLKASNTDADDWFGYSVAVSGDTIVVGAREEASGATGVNGDQSDNSTYVAGAAYVFVRNGATWGQQAYLKASNTEVHDWFGCSVAVSGDTVVIGAPGERSNATGVNGDQNDNTAYGIGAAYVYVRAGGIWNQQAYLKASNADVGAGPYSGDRFGRSVAISGDTVVVGADQEDSGTNVVNGHQNGNGAHDAGAAYVFGRCGTTWSQEVYLKASNSDAGDHFGVSVGVWSDTAVVGAYGEDSSATGVNGDQDNFAAHKSGAAYVFDRSGRIWTQRAYLKASNTDISDFFGISVAVFGDTVVVGAHFEDSSATGVDGDQDDDSLYSAGAAYVFERSGTAWSQAAYLKASNTDTHEYFGWAVDVSGDTVVIGAYREDSASTGVNGDQDDDSASEAGAVSLFSSAPGSSYCYGDPGSGIPCPCGNDNDGSVFGSGCANGLFAQGARLYASGVPSVSDDSLVLVTTQVEPNQIGLYFQGANAVNGGDGIIFGDGLRCVGGGLIRIQTRMSDAIGSAATTLSIGSKGRVLAGDIRHYQYWYRNPTASPCTSGFNLSNGYEITWLP